jgi:hypothetical protein
VIWLAGMGAAGARRLSPQVKVTLRLAPSPAQGQFSRKSSLTAVLRRGEAGHVASPQRSMLSMPPYATSSSGSHAMLLNDTTLPVLCA